LTPDGNSTVSGESLSTGVPASQGPGGPGTTSPAPVAGPARFCACNCGASLLETRADAVYASDACRKRHLRAASADKARTRRRRQTKKGKGGRLYLVPKELSVFERDFNPTSPEAQRVMEKVRELRKRLEGRAA
jgi:hypothetical protein